MRSQRPSIILILRKDKQRKNGECPIYFYITIDGTSIKIPSGEIVFEKLWDNKTKTVLNDKKISLRLNEKISAFEKFIDRCEALENPVNRETIKEHFRNVNPNDFYSFFEKYIENRECSLALQTLDKYRTTLKILKEFRRNSSLLFSDINYSLIEDFDTYLKGKRGNNGGEWNRHKNLKTVIKAAIKKGFKIENPYSLFKFKEKPTSTDYLTINEIEQLEILDILEDKINLRLVKDMFLFSCYTGLRFSDVITLKREHIDVKNKTLEKYQVKTKRKVKTGLSKGAIQIAFKNKSAGSEYFFAPISNQKANANLKKLAKMAKINKTLTFHMARHSYGSYLAENNVNLNTIRGGMGHATLKETQRYCNHP